MDSTGFENANKLWKAGRNEDAAREFRLIAEHTDYPDEKGGALNKRAQVLLPDRPIR